MQVTLAVDRPVCECRAAFVEIKDLQILTAAILILEQGERWHFHRRLASQHGLCAMREMAAHWQDPSFSKIWLHHHV